MELNITKFIKKETNLKDGNKSQKFTERELNVLIYKALKEQLILSGVVVSDEEKLSEHNTNVVSQFMEHCKGNGLAISEKMFETYFNA
jgi:SRSO17 transposase